MKRLAFACAVLLAAVAIAGQAARDSHGNIPSFPATAYGVTLAGATGCRCTARIDGGVADTIGSLGFASSGWKIIPYYYDDALGTWVESASGLHCSPAARADAGLIRQVVCPDMEPLAAFGRVACVKWGAAGFDAGSGADLINDGGIGQLPKFRTECWGPSMSSTP